MLPNLQRHGTGWPSEDQLLQRVKSGNPQRGRDHIGDGHDTQGSQALIDRIDSGTPDRPLNISIWGGQTDLAQALWRVKHDRGPEQLQRFVQRLRVYDINDQDAIADWLRIANPGIAAIILSSNTQKSTGTRQLSEN